MKPVSSNLPEPAESILLRTQRAPTLREALDIVRRSEPFLKDTVAIGVAGHVLQILPKKRAAPEIKILKGSQSVSADAFEAATGIGSGDLSTLLRAAVRAGLATRPIPEDWLAAVERLRDQVC